MDKKSISVPEMRRILGLGKTESYWLIKKGYFKTIMLFGKIRVMTDSFEEWYANQFHYKKTDGTPPGQNWRHTMSIRETADILGIAPTTVYSLIGKDLFNLLKMTSHMLDSQEDVKKELCKIIRSETKEKFQKMTETIKEYTEDKKVKEKIQASADYIMNNWSAAKKRLWKKDGVVACSAEGHVSHVLSSRMSTLAMGWSRKGASQMAQLREYYYNGGDMLKLVKHQKNVTQKAVGAEMMELSAYDILKTEVDHKSKSLQETAKYCDTITHHLSLQNRKQLTLRLGIYL